ncbi:hypothetical protein EUTSA_v10004967mg [Eutrema salsugineum]|uniref:Uncharacterized protein n=1 Tax=Eutrema salsugineum TaxID=72664 RepID=V4MMI3_EUTSA|nr:uncharacterized protein LOC18013432 [Eutrema salsugineum]ESQ32731.1 hypothetical protein EUTSA_v10004967mg [Eutrema salsugineum]
MKKNHATAARAVPETEISSNEALPVGGEASGPSLAFPSSAAGEGVVSGVGAGGDEAEGDSDELVGPSESSPELESGLEAGVLADDDFGGFAVAPPPDDGEGLGVAVVFFLVVVGAEAIGGEVGAEAGDFGDAAAAGEGDEFLSPCDFGAPAGVGGSAANTVVMANAATARDRSLRVIVIFLCECESFLL